MLSFLLMFVLVAAVLMVILWAGGVWFQGYIYSEPVAEIYWRAPVAAVIMALFVTFWCYLYSRAENPAHVDRVFAFSPRDDVEFPKFTSESQGRRTVFQKRKTARGLPEYREVPNGSRGWSRSDAVIVDEGGKEVRFEAERDAKGNYKRERSKPPPGLGWLMGLGPEQPLKYRDARGRVMTENDIGHLSQFKWGVFLGYVVLNLVHFGLWFACLWLLLRFQWSHALGVAVVFWLVMTLVIVPMLLDATPRRQATSAGVRAAVPRLLTKSLHPVRWKIYRLPD